MHIDDIRLPLRLNISTDMFHGEEWEFENFLFYTLDLVTIKVVKKGNIFNATVYIYSKEDSDKVMKWLCADRATTYTKCASNDFYTLKEIKETDSESLLENCNPNFKIKKNPLK